MSQKSQNSTIDYKQLLKLREEKQKQQQQNRNPFLLNTPKTDTALYGALYKLDMKNELKEYNLPFGSSEEKVKKPRQTRKKSDNTKELQSSQQQNDTHQMESAMIQQQSDEEEEIIQENDEQLNEQSQQEGSMIVMKKVVEDLFNQPVKKQLNKIQNALFIDQAVIEQIKLINNGEEAISFFAKYGNTTPIKFIYCVLEENFNGINFRPYDLKVIKQYANSKDINLSEYYTVSAHGIVHVFIDKNKSESKAATEVISLSDWMHESTLFNIITNIPFFKNYTQTKIFNLWKANMWYKRFQAKRDKLIRYCFIGKPAFSNHLIEFNKHAYDLQLKKCVSENLITQNKTWELDDFRLDQKKARTEASITYNNIVEKLIYLLENVCKEVIDNTQIREHDNVEEARFGKQVKQKPMNQIRREKEERVYFLELANNDKIQLRQFIRLIDYITIETLVKTNLSSMNTLLDEMKNEGRKQATGIFNSTVMFDTTSMSFNPNQKDLVETLMGVLMEQIKVVRETNRILEHSGFDAYIKQIGQSGKPDIQEIILNSVQYEYIKQEILNKVEQDFAESQTFVQDNYEKCRVIQKDTVTWDEQAFLASNPSLDVLNKSIKQLKEWQANITSLREPSKGIINIDGKKIKSKLLSHVTDRLNFMKDYMYNMMKDKSQILEDKITLYNEGFSKKPTDLSQFAKFIEITQECASKKEEIMLAKNDIEVMHGLLKKENIIKPNDSASLETILTGFTALERNIVSSQNLIREQKTDMISKFEKTQETLMEDIQACSALINSGALICEEIPQSEPIKDLKQCLLNISIVKSQLSDINKSITKFKVKDREINNLQKLLEMPITNNRELKDLEEKFTDRKMLWNNIEKFSKNSEEWFVNSFKELKFDEIEVEMRTIENQNVILKTRIHNLSNTGSDRVLETFIIEMKQISAMMPVFLALGNKDIQDRHWKKIFASINPNYQPRERFNFLDLKENGILDKKDSIEEISGRATGEAQIESAIENIKRVWSELPFVVCQYRDYKDKFIIGSVEDIMIALDDHQVSVQTMLGTRFVSEIRSMVEEWEQKLVLISEIIDEWLTCQRQWMYLENIFNAEDIQKQLPQETTKFFGIDKFWRALMIKTNNRPIVIDCCGSEELLRKLQASNLALDEIQKCLENYLETKRLGFPRFYFLSNDELLQILSQTRNPHAVQQHLRKCFDNINRIIFTEEEDSREIVAMQSAEPEIMPELVQFSQSVHILPDDKVENWLGKIEVMMATSLRDLTKICNLDYPPNKSLQRDGWLFGDYPSQSILVVELIQWSDGCIQAILEIENGKNQNAMKEYYDYNQKLMDSMVHIVRGELDLLKRTLMGALMVLDVHARDVVGLLQKANVQSCNDFDWQKQLRYEWNVEIDDCYARQTNTYFLYAYEYLGNGPRLVITPLTDNCYMTLTGALHLRFGGAPAGPAGTGKTETTKDLAKALATQCVVFNCSDSLDYRTMGRFFSGLAQCGAWACFDEFNRIDIEVLSVIAQQILQIQNNVKLQNKIFEFEGRMIPLNFRFGVFITMNPGYAGRTELPDNLKALFRPVAMMIPDYRLIAEIILFSEGFVQASLLSNKMTQLYKLSSEQLSKQKHYDFGMRAVKSVLVMAGSLRRDNPHLTEDLVLIRALRDSNIPKFLEQDIPLFSGIIKDLFPTAVLPINEYPDLERAVADQIEQLHLQKTTKFVKKIIELIETMKVRHGVMLVGSTGTGKTKVYEILRAALMQLHSEELVDYWYKKVQLFKLNPKSVSMNDLYGYVNVLTNEWTDGIVAKIVRDAVSEVTEDKRWLMFDGPVDAIWIENLNTVLDDNKMLCLSNGQRIKLPQTFTMMFEVNDLKEASPATVSRCGMVYLDTNQLGWEPILETWSYFFKEKELFGIDKNQLQIEGQQNYVASQPFQNQVCAWLDRIKNFIKENFPYVRQECKEVIASVDINLVQGGINIMNTLFAMLKQQFGGIQKMEKMAPADLDARLNMILIFSYIWSIGGNLHDDPKNNSRSKFSQQIKGKILKIFQSFPFEGEVYDYFINFEKKEFRPWTEMEPVFQYNKNTPFFNIMVPTADTVKFGYLLDKLVSRGYNVLITGETGTGKSCLAGEFVMNLDKEKFVFSNMNFSAQTSAYNLQDLFMDKDKFTKKVKNQWGPKQSGKQMVIMIDDVNMPQLEKYGAQPPIELLRQIIDHGGFYDLKKLMFYYIKDCIFLNVCAPPSGGRNPVTPRLFRHFNMLWMPDLSNRSMEHIFNSILKGFLQENPNKIEGGGLDKYSMNIVKSTIAIYNRVTRDLLPTPSKCHYTFNLRDVSKVFQGILQIGFDQLTSKDLLLSLWSHEIQRVFFDRLVDEKDRDWFITQLSDQLTENLNTTIEQQALKDIVYGDFANSQREYMKIERPQDLGTKLTDFLSVYNVTYPKQMHLVFFKDAISHVARISRILKQPRGNCLIIGVSGSGRSSLTRLAAFCRGFEVFEIEITKNYKEAAWKDDLKKLLKQAGSKNQQTLFLFSDTQIVRESFLEDINNVLNTGEVPNLMAPEDLNEIIEDVRPMQKELGLLETREVALKLFVQLVRENLHIVLTFSPVGEKLRNRCRQFPSIINCCTIDWFDRWPNDALFSVAEREFKQYDHLGIGQYKDKLAELCVEIHLKIIKVKDEYYDELRRPVYITPTSYLELIKLYIEMLKFQQNILPLKIRKYTVGLQTLADTNVEVGKLQEKIVEFQPILEVSQKENAELLVELEIKTKIANETEAVVSKEAAIAQTQADEVNELKTNCQRDLDAAMPMLENAQEAVKRLDKAQLQTMKSFAQPPELVKTVMEGVCLLFGEKEDWDSSKKLLGKMTFMQELVEFQVDKCPEKRFFKLRDNYLSNPKMNKEEVGKVSSAALGIFIWLVAIDSFQKVKKVIGPKQVALKQAEDELKIVMGTLDKKMAALKEVQDTVTDLNNKLTASMKKAQNLKIQMENATVQLARAEKLLDGLGSESERWKVSESLLLEDLKNLTGNMILSAAFLAYLPPFSTEYRRKNISEFTSRIEELEIPVGKGFTLERVLSTEVQIRDWQDHELPADQLSTENGIIMYNSRRWPLIIDPQNQANNFIRKLQADNNLQVIKLTESNFLKVLENSIQFGQPCLLENVENQLDPSLEPVLLKQTFKKGPQLLLKLGDKDITYSPEFRFYITTKLPNPHYLPEVAIKVTLINFNVTPAGLEDQLLVEVVRQERIDLEERRINLMMQISQDKKQLQDLEDKILKLISEVQGRILEDEELIVTLDSSKITSDTVNNRMKLSKTTSEEIRVARESYRVVAKRGSVLYFSIADLSLIDPMYQYSLEFFTKLFRRRLELSEQSSELQRRLQILIDDITISMYTNICRGLFEKDKQLYSFLIATKIQLTDKVINAKNWNYFLRGAGATAALLDSPLDKPDWLLDGQWQIILQLSKLHSVYQQLPQSLCDEENKSIWQNILESETPFDLQLPMPFAQSLDAFLKLLLVKALRPEKLMGGIRVYINDTIGKIFTQSPVFDLSAAFLDSTSTTPIIFVLSSGADPMVYLLDLAKQKDMFENRLKILSLGQGQGEKAEEFIKSGRRNGDWVCLQNCHLAVSWLQTLERIQENQVESETHPDYRLWLTSCPSPKFPVPVLQAGIKLTNEPPKGLKANLKRTYNEIKQENYDDTTKPREYKKLLFSLAFFHAIILERKKFGPIGWNIQYGWMNSDFETSQLQLKMHIEEQPEVPYQALNVIVAQINYGGRVTDNKDVRTILAILAAYFCSNVMLGKYNFSSSGNYYSPDELELQSVRDYIENLPPEDEPEVFGLHFNSNITFQQKTVKEFMDTLLNVSPRQVDAKGVGESPDEIASRLASEIEKKIIDPLKYVISDDPQPLEIFRNQEIERYNVLIREMKKSLNGLQKAIKGLVVMSLDLENMYTAFLNSEVPENWTKVAYPSLKPLGSWVTDFVERMVFYQQWIDNPSQPSYWISALLFPQGFMTSVLQTYARLTQIPIDTLVFKTSVWKKSYEPQIQAIGVNLHGLFLQGCRWDDQTMQLEESFKKELFTTMPCLWLEPVTIEQYSYEGCYQCPLYKTSLRAGELSTTGHSTNFVLFLDLKSEQEEAHWVRRGVALLCQLDD